jgi:hypothetical protein
LLSLQIGVIVLSLVSGIILIGFALRACLRRQGPTAALYGYVGALGIGLAAIMGGLLVSNLSAVRAPDHPSCAANGGCGDDR